MSSMDQSRLFPLVVQPTYYKQGFFNVTVEFDSFVRPTRGSVAVFLGSERRRIEARVDRSANQNGTARVMGGVELRDWFQRRCKPGDTVYVDLVSPAQMSITADPPAPQDRLPTPGHAP